MKNIIAISLSAGLVLGALGLTVRAMNPQPGVPTTPAKETGRVLVLQNERTLTGDIERVGDQYRIKRLLGETWIPTSKAVKLCSSLDEAYQFLKSRANLNDADERLRLADWCRQHALKDRAVEEVTAAAELKPGDQRIRRLLSHLKEVQARAQSPAVAAKPVEEPSGPHVEVTAESLGLFATKVQPILMNACVSCHTGGRGGNFQLTRVTGPGLAYRKSTERNLAAVLANLNAREPASSKLLSKAISIHGAGMTQAPLKNREAAAFRSLEYWVVRTAVTNPHLREESHASATAANDRGAGARGDEQFGQDREGSTQGPAASAPTPMPMTEMKPAVTPISAGEAKPTPMPPSKPDALDPVDPEGFNREFHNKTTESPRGEKR